jgi:amino acid transporter
MTFARIKRFILGEPLTSFESHHQLIPKWKALSTLSSDALSSVAYATDATLAVLVAFSMAAAVWTLPIAIAITALLAIVTVSYRQTIQAYPTGGGAYTVAKENLGIGAGLVAGTALLIDYVLTVSVSVASGIENIMSAFPEIIPHKVGLGILVIVIIMIMNLRGIRESATVFAFPTYFFIFSVILLIGTGIWKYMIGHAVTAAPLIPQAMPAVPLILILRAFGSGCSALTGVEAISNGVSVFRAPAAKNAKLTMIWMSCLLASFFLGISLLAHVFGIIPKEDQTVISLLGLVVFGKTGLYYMVQVATALILFLAANTSYADFPRLSSLLARDGYMPRQLASQGDRLVFSNGIIWLSLSSMLILWLFRGETLHMIPLYAIGVFLSFTLSQSGMVLHHLREKEPHWLRSAFINTLGAITTFIVLSDIAFTKFIHGAWIVVLSIPVLILFFRMIHSHYSAVGKELALGNKHPWKGPHPLKHTVIIPISGVHQGVLEAIRYGVTISDDVRGCCVEIDPASALRIKEEWEKWAPSLPFFILKSPYRSVLAPILEFIDDVCRNSHDDMITVLVPEFITKHWWHRFLHNQTAIFLRAALSTRKRVAVTAIRLHLNQ